MKKIFSIFASSVLALSMFVSCSGDLHNDMDPAKVALIMGETKTILDEQISAVPLKDGLVRL
ncbi:MAG: hypothetical protein IIW80_04480 [Treponema sp.]|nr:hypothetical protein [Treponema sp.]